MVRRSAAPRIVAALMACIAGVGAPGGVGAQEPVDSLRAELARLQARIDSLEAAVARLRGAGEDTTAVVDELAAIRAAAAAAAAAPADTTAREPADFVGRQRSQQALNPEITVTGDVFGFVDMEAPDERNFVPRELEISFQSALDPYSLARIYVGYHTPGGEILPFGEAHDEAESGEEEGHGGGFEVEEAYVRWLGLPGGLNLQLGRFRQGFGQLNRWHPHALPGQSYPLPYVAFFGEEGLTQTGVGLHWLAPVTGLGTWELWTEVTASGNEALFGEATSPSVLGRINAFWELSPSTYFEVGASGIAGPGMAGGGGLPTRVAGTDFTLSWRPPERSRYREATLRGGLVYGELAPEVPGEMEPGGAFGAFASAEYRLNRSWVLGGRYEYTENPLAPDESSWLAAPTVTWWQSEWVRVRVEFDYLDRPEGPLKLLVLQTTFAMGPHKHETY